MQRKSTNTGARRTGAARLTAAALRAGGLALCLAAAADADAQPPTSELGAYLTVATDARARGLSQTAGDSAVRFGLDYQHPGGFFAGGVLGNVAYEGAAGRRRPRDALVELYAGYLWRGADWGVTAALGHYGYPDTDVDYDHRELSAVVDFRDRYYYRFTYTDDLLAAGYAAATHELGIALALPAGLELGASVGRFRARGARSLTYTHYDVGVSRLVGRFGLDLRRYDTSREVVDYLGSSTADRWVFSLSYAIRPRP